MAAAIGVGTIFNSTRRTLDKIITDEDIGKENCDYQKWCTTKSMSHEHADFLEMGGPAFMSVKSEHQEMAAGDLNEGYLKRFTAITYALQMIISREAMDDNKYQEAVILMKRLKRSAEKTKDMLLTGMLVEGWNTAVGIGDGLSLFNQNHTLPDGGTFSNTLAVPLAPSVTAYATIRAAVKKMPDHTGVVEGYKVNRVLCPVEQEQAWEEILYSKFVPQDNNFATINVANRDLASHKHVLVPLRFWDNTTTNWCVQTFEKDGGPCLLERKKLTPVSWVDDGHLSLHSGMWTRFAYGTIDARSMYGSQI